jgi:hypothetical protein
MKYLLILLSDKHVLQTSLAQSAHVSIDKYHSIPHILETLTWSYLVPVLKTPAACEIYDRNS